MKPSPPHLASVLTIALSAGLFCTACGLAGTTARPPASAGAWSRDPAQARGTARELKAARGTSATTGTPTEVYSHGDPTLAEQYVLELINRARANPTAEAARFGIDLNEGLAPGTLSDAPRAPLTFNVHLVQAARDHSSWMLAQDTFSHTGAGGTDPGDRMRAAGYVFSGSWTWGENIAWRGTTGTLDLYSAVAQSHEDLFVDSGVPGRGHRVNLLNQGFREIGIGVEEGVFTSQNVDYNAGMTTQDFAASGAQPAAFLVGVVYADADGDGFYTPGEGLAGVTVSPASGTYYAVTSTSGGFAIPLETKTGTLAVTIAGGPVAAPVTKTSLLTGQNVKLDFNTAIDVPAIALTAPTILPNGQFTFGVTGPTGASVEVQSTEDLTQWSDRQTLTLGAGTTFTDAQTAAAAHRYYRVVQR